MSDRTHKGSHDFRVGCEVEVFSKTQNDWFAGKIVGAFSDDEGDWLVIEYRLTQRKEVMRESKDLRPRCVSIDKLRVGSEVEFYSKMQKKWFAGKVIGISEDDKERWLEVEYNVTHRKDVLKCSKQIRAVSPREQPHTKARDFDDESKRKQKHVRAAHDRDSTIEKLTTGIAAVFARMEDREFKDEEMSRKGWQMPLRKPFS